jgi:hypothetical protein
MGLIDCRHIPSSSEPRIFSGSFHATADNCVLVNPGNGNGERRRESPTLPLLPSPSSEDLENTGRAKPVLTQTYTIQTTPLRPRDSLSTDSLSTDEYMHYERRQVCKGDEAQVQYMSPLSIHAKPIDNRFFFLSHFKTEKNGRQSVHPP